MCGIYGIISLTDGGRRPPETLDRMGDSILHRGPDDSGRYADGELLLGMRRLSIIDVSGGHQPIASEDGQVVVVCNGEIYNFRELRRELEARGHRFATHSDSEVAVHAYEEFGDEFLKKLEGMFGLALWDRRRRRLLVARDAYGIKPIYYLQNGSELIFASEAKAILAVPGIEARLDPAALSQYLSVGYVAAPNAIFARMRKLEPGRVLVDVLEGWESLAKASDVYGVVFTGAIDDETLAVDEAATEARRAALRAASA